MSKFKYGRGNKHFFTILTPVNSNSIGIVARFYYENAVTLSYKDYTRLAISCDKGPEVCEGEFISAIDITTGELQRFKVKKITHNDEVDIWTAELEHEVPSNESN